jgi:glycosyltransferase involved in cell wall biosynthesis
VSKPRFFIGLIEICDTILLLSEGLREKGYPVTNLVISSPNPLARHHGHDKYIEVSWSGYLFDLTREFMKSLTTHDIFVFNYCTSFCRLFFRAKQYQKLNFLDVSILKNLGKKIVFISNGDDLRSYKMLIKDLKRNNLLSHAKYIKKELQHIAPFPNYESVRKKKAHLVQKYADVIFAKPDRAHHLTKEYHIVWPPFDLDSVKYDIKQSDDPLIVHAPSNRNIKGTKYILRAIKNLKNEYKFTFLLCEAIPNEELRANLAKSEIVIDQILLPGYGLFGIEAMATGNAVLGSAVPGYNGFPERLPIVTTTPDTIYENLKNMLEDPELRRDLAQKGRAYVEKYHDYKKVTADFLQKIGA